MSSFGQPAMEIPFMCSNASQRLVVASFFSDSAATRPANNLQGSQATILVGPNAISTSSTWRSSGTSTGPGAYYLVLTQSECSSQGGPGYVTLYTSTATIGTVNIPVFFPRVDSYDTMRYGLFALPNVAAAAAGGLPTFGTGTGQLNVSGGSVGLVPGIMSGVSVEVKATGIVVASVGVGNYSGVSVEVKATGIVPASVGAGSYSGVSVEVKTGGIQTTSVGAGTYSGVTVQGLSNYANISNVTLAAGTHSNVTIQGISNYANISNVTLAAGTHSNVTIQGVTRVNSGVTLNADTHSGATIQGVSRLNSGVTLNADTHSGATIAGIVAGGIIASTLAAGAITSAKFAAGAIDTVALATDAVQELADGLLGRNVAGGSSTGRTVSEALYVLRNKVAIDNSVVTVYGTDDTTSAWTGAVTIGGSPINGVDPL